MALPAYAVKARSFDPRSVPGLAAWYDAADSASVTLDAGRVSQWSDKSGSGRHATNATSGATQPSYSSAARNGLNVLTFEAASVQRLTVSGTSTFNFLHNGTESFVVAVVKYGTVSDPQAIYALFGNSGLGSAGTGASVTYDDRVTAAGFNNAFQGQINAGTSGQFTANCFDTPNAIILPEYNNAFTPQAYCVQEIVFHGGNATAAQRLRLRLNGGSEVAANNKTFAASTANATYAMQFGATGAGGSPLQGDICELAFFSQLPSTAARDLIRRYLAKKWGVTLA